MDRLTVFYERIAPGDRIPLHAHAIDEVFFVDEGRLEARVGDERSPFVLDVRELLEGVAADGVRPLREDAVPVLEMGEPRSGER